MLRLVMGAKLLPGETRATPVCLAGHSYFNLSSHSSSNRILDHVLRLPNSDRYTPLDVSSIPTREVRRVYDDDYDGDDDDKDGTTTTTTTGGAMDFRDGRTLAEALERTARMS